VWVTSFASDLHLFMDYLDYQSRPYRPPALHGRSRAAQWALVVATVLAGCGVIEPATTDGGASDTEAVATETGTTETGTTGSSNVAGCECLPLGVGLPQNVCAMGVQCGLYHEGEVECADGTGLEPGEEASYAESNAMVLQCILDAAAAGDPFRFEHREVPGGQHSCSTEYAAAPDGMLQLIFTEQLDLCFDYVTSIKSGFDLAACQGMSGTEGWACVYGAIGSATTEGTCGEDSYCEFS
jgi:hypothetical protein